MRTLILLATLVCYTAHAAAQDYIPYGYAGSGYAPPEVNYYNSQPRTNSYVQTIENNGPQVDQRRNAERMNRQIEYTNTIRNYELIYGDRHRR